MSRNKKLTIGGVAALFITSVVLAASAHFINCSSTAKGDNLDVSFKIAGLGNEVTCVTVTADASATYLCINGGNKNPSAANKRTVSEQRTATDCFTPHNGQITGTLTLTAPGPGDFTCPPGQRLVLQAGSVSYANVKVVDTTHNVTCTP
jgi:hypothetical protein